MVENIKKNSWVKNIVRKVLDRHTPIGVAKEWKGWRKDVKARDDSIIEATQMEWKRRGNERMTPSYLINAWPWDKKKKEYKEITKRIKKEVI